MNEQERRSTLSQFLRSRRERLSPEQAGIVSSKRRRTPGLRREELALAAGIGVTWYTRLEQGRDITVSAPVLESLARVLQLDADERTHLFILARQQLPTYPVPPAEQMDPALDIILETMGFYPAYVICPRWDIIAWNDAASQVYANFQTMSPSGRNWLYFIFTNQRARTQLVDWETEAQHVLALFRVSTQCYIGEPWLTEIITRLQQKSPEFRQWWAQYDVQGMYTRQKQINHPSVGLLHLQATSFQLTDHPEYRMIIETPVAGTDTQAKLRSLSTFYSTRQSLHIV